MMRLAGGTDIMRQMVSEQTVAGLWTLFGADRDGGIVDKMEVVKFLEEAPHIMTDNGISDWVVDKIKARLEQMYVVAIDPWLEYTLDEFGEFLMDEMMLVLRERGKDDWPDCGSLALHECLKEECEPELYDALCWLPALTHDGKYDWILFWDRDFILYWGWSADGSCGVPPCKYQKCTLDGQFVDVDE